MILLDLRKDKYHVFDVNQSKKLDYILKTKWVKINSYFTFFDNHSFPKYDLEDLNIFIKELIFHGFLEKVLQDKIDVDFDNGRLSTGAYNIDWHLPLQKSGSFSCRTLMSAFAKLLHIHCIVQFRGLESLIKMIEKKGSFKTPPIIPKEEDIKTLCHSLNQACRLYPVRTKCLEWASVLTVMGLERGWDITLNIGVQNYPFLAHAWAEINGQVVCDDPLLPLNLSKILSVPSVREAP